MKNEGYRIIEVEEVGYKTYEIDFRVKTIFGVKWIRRKVNHLNNKFWSADEAKKWANEMLAPKTEKIVYEC
jgi:hypothetical protein